ncbi:TlpA disulfide reductase family protein [Chitinophaga japonensis]|uniref:Peroxiredoxin n=1 Tax=Chitinophaga japonensis TaxID=104662 RepID=A0A562TD41_CHIJA|nr:TlpA disulfide reductase family protein [Chitinophaga japonensis]TWI91405.1 peroxiredoxin [Chitinophaga japonensis]
MRLSNMRKIALWLTIGMLLAGCGQQTDKGSFNIDVHLSNAPLGQVFLEELTLKEVKVADTTSLKDASGRFALSGTVPEQGLYRIRFGNSKYILLALGADDIKIEGDYNNLDKITIRGSEASVALQQLLNEANEKGQALTLEMRAIDSLQGANTPDSILQAKVQRLQQQEADLQQSFISHAEKTPYPANAVFALSMVNDPTKLIEQKQVINSIAQRFPDNSLVSSLSARISEMEQQAGAGSGDEANMTAVKVGDTAPDFTLPDPSGKMVKLSSFRGKYVLVDFWASWCKPCRMENPNVVKAYQQYKDKNFTILGVSLDKKKEAWVQAIQADGLTWNHVSDLKFWDSAVVPLYGINAIPTNFLLDPQGKIIAANLRGNALEQKLQEVVK